MRRAAILLGICVAVVVPVALAMGLWRGSAHWLSVHPRTASSRSTACSTQSVNGPRVSPGFCGKSPATAFRGIASTGPLMLRLLRRGLASRANVSATRAP